MFKKVTKIALAGIIGVGTMIGSSSLVSAEDIEYKSEALVKFKQMEIGESTPVVHPEAPHVEVEIELGQGETSKEPGTTGLLSIDHASNINFGEVELSGNKKTYIANPTKFVKGKDQAPYVQITDSRGSKGGWELQVQQESEFATSDELESSSLGATELTLSQGEVSSMHNYNDGVTPAVEDIVIKPDNSPHTVFSAEEGYGAGTYFNTFGELEENKATAISLEVPANLKIDTDAVYSTSLTWTMLSGPQE